MIYKGTKPYLQPLPIYVGSGIVLSEAQAKDSFGDVEASGRRALASARERLATATDLQDICKINNGQITFKKNDGRYLAYSGDELVFMETLYFPYTKPEYRGQGISTVFNMLRDDTNTRKMTLTYSEGGFHARVKTHRRHVERAMRSGKEIPESVMKSYEVVGENKIRLRTPYTPQMHNAMTQRIGKTVMTAIGKRSMNNGLIPFTDTENYDEQMEILPFVVNRYNTALLAKRLQKEFGGQILHTACHPQDIFQLLNGDKVIDCFGIRDREKSLDELWDRSLVWSREETDEVLLDEMPDDYLPVKEYMEKPDVMDMIGRVVRQARKNLDAISPQEERDLA